MRCYWLRDRARQKKSHIFWRRGKDTKHFNLGTFFGVGAMMSHNLI